MIVFLGEAVFYKCQVVVVVDSAIGTRKEVLVSFIVFDDHFNPLLSVLIILKRCIRGEGKSRRWREREIEERRSGEESNVFLFDRLTLFGMMAV